MRNAICEAEGMDTPGQRLKWARENKSEYETATAAAKAFGWTVPTYLGHENGDRVPSRKAAIKYSHAYKVPWAWILEGGPLPTSPRRRYGMAEEAETPIAHYVGAGDEVHLIGEDGAIDYTPSPPGFERDRGAAVIVRGESMRPIFDPGDMLFFRHRRDPPTAAKDLPARPVIVETAGGALYVKKLLPGSKKGRFHLLSINPLTPPMQDQPVRSFAYIEWVKPLPS